MKIWKALERFWDNGMLSIRVDADRYDSLFVAGGMMGINLLVGVFWFEIYYPTMLLGIFFLALDNHNLKEFANEGGEEK